MGLNKRHVIKESVLACINNLDLLFKSEILILDEWSAKFKNDLNPKEREIRNLLNEKYKYDSGLSFLNDDLFNDLKSLSETLISLYKSPSWIDVFVANKILKFEVTEDESGRFSILVDKSKKAIITHYDLMSLHRI